MSGNLRSFDIDNSNLIDIVNNKISKSFYKSCLLKRSTIKTSLISTIDNFEQIINKNAQNKLLKKYFFRQSMPFCHYSGHNLWILKATKLNQG